MAAAFGVTPVRAELPVLRIAVLPVGTVNWELDTIRHHGLDTANGFTLEVQGVAGGAAAMVAFQGGAADAMVSDGCGLRGSGRRARISCFSPIHAQSVH